MQEYRKSPDGFGTMYFFGICTSGTVSAGLSLATVAAALVAPQYCPILGKIAAASLLIPGLLVFNLLRIEKIQHRLESYYKP